MEKWGPLSLINSKSGTANESHVSAKPAPAQLLCYLVLLLCGHYPSSAGHVHTPPRLTLELIGGSRGHLKVARWVAEIDQEPKSSWLQATALPAYGGKGTA